MRINLGLEIRYSYKGSAPGMRRANIPPLSPLPSPSPAALHLSQAPEGRRLSDTVSLALELTEEHLAVTVCFMDMVGFTAMTATHNIFDVVKTLNFVFSLADHTAKQYNVTKIKTIGDCYMAAGGLQANETDSELQMIRCGLVDQEDWRGWFRVIEVCRRLWRVAEVGEGFCTPPPPARATPLLEQL